MPTRLLINATILNLPRQTGLGVYTANLLRPLLQRLIDDQQFEEIVVAGKPEALRGALGAVVDNPRIRVRPIETAHPIYRLWALDQLVVAERKRLGRLMFYSPTHHGVLRGGIIQIITVHDLFARIFPHNYRRQYYYFRWYFPRILAKTSHVIVDSVSTGDDLRKFYWPCPPTDVVHAALRTDLASVSPKEVLSLRGQKYFMFVGPNYPYKNCLSLIDAFAQYRQVASAKLVFVGGREAYLKELKRFLAEKHPSLSSDVLFLNYIWTEELAWLYQHASALMLTTLYEGFGLPALEAMACGCPVIASRAGSLPDVCGQAALFIEPTDVDGIAQAMREVESDLSTREQLVLAGRENVKRFSWDLSAEKVYHVLRSCLKL